MNWEKERENLPGVRLFKILGKIGRFLMVYITIGVLVSVWMAIVHPQFYGDDLMVRDLCFTVLAWPFVAVVYGIAHKG